jgi:hypothetical protein
MKYISPILKTLALLLLASWLWYLTFDYIPYAPGFDPPFFAIIGHALNTIVHEAGHFIFKIFGKTMYVLGGSLFQALFPLGIAVFVWFRWREYAVYPLFWLGWNLIDVAVYIYDAPFLLLNLIGGGKSGHDWRYLMRHFNAMDEAVEIALIVHWLGVAISLAALVWGAILAVQAFRDSVQEYSLMETPDPFKSPDEDHIGEYNY